MLRKTEQRSKRALWESTVHFPLAFLSPTCYEKREVYYVFWGWEVGITFSLKSIMGIKDQIKKQSAEEAVLKHFIIMCHGDTTHEAIYLFTLCPTERLNQHTWNSSSHSVPHQPPLLSQTPGPLSSGFSLCSKSKFQAVLQQLSTITSKLQALPPSPSYNFIIVISSLASYKLESFRKC